MKKALHLAGATLCAPPGRETVAGCERSNCRPSSTGQQSATNASAGSGKAEAKFDNGTKVVTCTGTCSDLHGPGAVDKNACTALAFRSASSPIKGTGTFSDIRAADLVGDKLYANIHTAATAELRGPMAMQVIVLFLISGDVVLWRKPPLGGRAGQKS
jgi:hypothetical protein